VGDLVGRETVRGEAVLRCLEQRRSIFLRGHDELAKSFTGGKSCPRLNCQLVEREVIAREHQRLIELALPGGKALAGPGIDQIERKPGKASPRVLDCGERLASIMRPTEKA